MSDAPASGAAPSLLAAAFQGLCPNCGARTLFAGLASFAPKCRACGLDFSTFNVGDGPAAFLILIVGAIVAVGAILLDQGITPALVGAYHMAADRGRSHDFWPAHRQGRAHLPGV